MVDDVLWRVVVVYFDDWYLLMIDFVVVWRDAVNWLVLVVLVMGLFDLDDGMVLLMLGSVMVVVVNLYKGLCAFDEVDVCDFYGCEVVVECLVVLVCEWRFVVVVGVLGSGKSFFVRVGFVLVLRVEGWFVAVVVLGV